MLMSEYSDTAELFLHVHEPRLQSDGGITASNESAT